MRSGTFDVSVTLEKAGKTLYMIDKWIRRSYGEVERDDVWYVMSIATLTAPLDGNVIAFLFGRGLLFDQLLDQLLFLNKKCPHNPILDTICAARSTVCTLYCFLVLGKTGVFLGAKGGNLIVSHKSKVVQSNNDVDKSHHKFQQG